MSLALALASCAESREVGEPIGAPCEADGECESAVCAGRCTTTCDETADCLAGWSCAGAEPVCLCSPSDERCDGRDDDCDGEIDEGASSLCGEGLACDDGVCRCDGPRATGELDLLFAIDDSSSMAEEQASLAQELPRLMRALVSGDRDGDGVLDFEPVRSLQVGVISSDMGTGGFAVPTCDSGLRGLAHGDDGLLLTAGNTAIPGCMETYPSVLEFAAGGDAARFASDVACLATTGTGGCGFEQQLEAVLKALSPSAPTEWTVPGYLPPVFHGSTTGHADGANSGFVRPGSVLAVLVMTDEEDCSWSNPELPNLSSPDFASADLSLRCFAFPEALHPVERYAAGVGARAGLLGLRRDPGRLVFGVIAGMPPDSIEDPSRPDYDAILDHPEMQERVDPSFPSRLVRACSTPGGGVAFPARRVVRTAQALERGGARAMVASICQASLAAPVDAFVDRVADALSRPECR